MKTEKRKSYATTQNIEMLVDSTSVTNIQEQFRKPIPLNPSRRGRAFNAVSERESPASHQTGTYLQIFKAWSDPRIVLNLPS